MRAIIMAGGEGRRLRPITDERPKPMAPILGRPILAYVIDEVKKYGVQDILLTLRYRPECIESWFGTGEKMGVHLSYYVEEEELGTAGGVRAAADFARGEDILIMSGDGILDFDLGAFMAFHREKGAFATLALYEHPSPTEYGLCLTDQNGRITAFVEKPAWEGVLTDRANTGVYLLSHEALMAIPSGEEQDFGKDVFPRFLREGRSLYGWNAKGYWCDVGNPEAYRTCALRMAGTESYIGEGTALEADAYVRDSVVNGARIGRSAVVIGAVVCQGAKIGERAVVLPGSAIGDGAEIGAGALIGPGARVRAHALVPPGAVLRAGAEDEEEKPVFTARGILEGTITPDAAVRLGAALGPFGRCGVALEGGRAALCLGEALTAGVTGAGGEAILLDSPFEAALGQAAAAFSLDAAVFFRQEGEKVSAAFFSQNGVPALPELERALTRALETDSAAFSAEKTGGTSRVSGAGRRYLTAAAGGVRSSVAAGPEVSVEGRGPEAGALAQTLAVLGLRVVDARSGVPRFHVQARGFELTAADEDGKLLSWHRLQCAAAAAAVRLGERDVAVPREAPGRVEQAVRKAGGVPHREGQDPAAQTLLVTQRFLTDGVYAAARLGQLMRRDGVRLRDLVPDFGAAELTARPAVSAARVMRELAGAFSAELAGDFMGGLTLRKGTAAASVRPSRDGTGIRISAEGDTDAAGASLAETISNAVRSFRA